MGVPVWSATVPASCLLVGRCSSPAPGDRCLRADWTTAGSRGAAGQSRRGPRSALDAGGGQVAARPAGNRPVRARAQGSRARRRRRGRSPPAASSPPPTGQGPPDQPRPPRRGRQPPRPLPPPAGSLAGPPHDLPGEGNGGRDPDRAPAPRPSAVARCRRPTEAWPPARPVPASWPAGAGRADGWTGRPGSTQASPGWAWRTASGSIRGRSPMRALANPRGP